MAKTLPRIPVPTTADSAALAKLPAQLRAQALFSARLNLVDPLAEIGRSISGILSGTKSASESRRDIRAALAAADYEPTGSGIKDHTTQKRLDLILQQNVRAARGYARRREGMDPDTLDLWPAQELVRVYGRKVPRDWKARFVESGGNLVSGRMIALKTSPVWMSLSRFGVPWPPFDFGSGMGVRDISRKEAESLGLITPEETLTPEDEPYNFDSQTTVEGADASAGLRAAILKAMGGTAKFEGNVLHLDDPAITGAAEKTPATIRAAEAAALIRTNQAAVRDPDGTVFKVPESILKGSGKDAAKRLSTIRTAFDTVRNPSDSWQAKGIQFYTKTYANGKTAFAQAKDGNIITWGIQEGGK